MSKGHGRIERTILALLDRNKHLSAPVLAIAAYQDKPSRQATPSERAATRRALSKLQKQGLVVKLGNMWEGERCSYANRANATALAARMVRSFGTSALRDHRNLAELYAEDEER